MKNNSRILFLVAFIVIVIAIGPVKLSKKRDITENILSYSIEFIF
jgi:hypothetical protein